MTPEKLNSIGLADNPNLAVAVLTGVTSETPGILYVNKGFSRITGYQLSDVEAWQDGDIWELLRETDRDYLKHTYRMKYCKNTGYQCCYQLVKKDGAIVYVQDNGYFFENSSGEACAQMILADITGVQAGRQELCDCKCRLEMGLRSSNSCIFEVDLKRQLHTYFENAPGLFGISNERILADVRAFSSLDGEEFREAVADYFVYPDDQGLILELFERVLDGAAPSCEVRMKVCGGRFVWCRVNATPVMEHGIPVRMIGIITNINQIKRRADKYKSKAARDLFTGLYNKQHAQLLIRGGLGREREKKHALLLIDVDNLKKVNDTYGHGVGDEVIRAVSCQLKRVFRKNDVLGRFGGDEFIVLMKDICGKNAVEGRMGEILKSIGGYPVTKSVGIAIFPKDGEDFDTLFQCADSALYESKRKKNAYTFFHEKTQDIP